MSGMEDFQHPGKTALDLFERARQKDREVTFAIVTCMTMNMKARALARILPRQNPSINAQARSRRFAANLSVLVVAWIVFLFAAVATSVILSFAAPTACLAGPGSGTAEMWPKIDAGAGTYNRWTIRYTATEDFYWLYGGTVTIEIPAGWSAPQLSDSTVDGFILATSSQPQDLDSVNVVGTTIRLHLGAFPYWFGSGEYVEIIYGASSRYARTQTAVQDSVPFVVESDPDGNSPQALAYSPKVNVVAGPLTRIAVFFAGSEAGALNLTADQNSNVFTARGLDAYDNVLGGVQCNWNVTGGIGQLLGGKDSTSTFDANKAGTGYVIAQDDFAHVDSTGLLTVTHGAYNRLDVAQPDTAVAGTDFPVAVAALDADGNIVNTGVGSNAALTLSAWRDSVGGARGAGNLSVTEMNLSQGQASIDEKYFVAEPIYIRAVDEADTTVRDFGPRFTFVKPAAPSVLGIAPDTLSIEAGTQGTFTLTSIDSFGNVSPVSLPQTLHLWTDSPAGQFREPGGGIEISETAMSKDSSRVSFDYYDTGTGEFQVVLTDVDANAPAFSPVTAYVSVHYSAEDTLIVSGISDPVVAGNPSDVVVEARDRFGNRVSDYYGTITFSSTDKNQQTILPLDYIFAPPDSGRHIFPLSVELTRAGEQSVSATDVSQPSLNGIQSGITVVPQNCDSLLLRVSSTSVTAGDWLDLEVEASDEYGNTAAGYTGVVGFASSDTSSTTVLPAYYGFAPSDSGFHAFSRAVRLTTVGTHTISISDTSQTEIDGVVTGIEVNPGPPSILDIAPDTLSLEAGTQGAFTLTTTDSFGNISAVSLPQTFYLWTNSASGEFREAGGNVEIFDEAMAGGSSQASFDYYDTGTGELQIAVMDVDTNAPALSPVTAHVSVRHSLEDTLVVSGISDPVVAGNPSNLVVEVRDRVGNRVRDYDGTVGFSSTDNNPETVLPPNYTFVSPDSGRHVFPLSVRLTRAGEQSVSASDVSQPLVDGVQREITVLPQNCDSLLLRASSMSRAAGEWLDVEIEAVDQFRNRAAGYAGVVAFSSTDAGDSTMLPALYRFAPSDSGLHVFTRAVRLTTAGNQAVSASDTSEVQIDGVVAGIKVRAGAPASILLFPPGSFRVNAGGTQVLSATANDAFGNSPFGEPVSIVIKDAADGSLDDDPANSDNTSGGVSIQTGATDSSGVVTALYRAPQVSGLSDTIDAYCSSVNLQSVADVFITSSPAGATSLRVLPVSAMADTAGAVLSISVEATDSFGNIDTSATSLLRITVSSPSARVSTSGGSTWSASAVDSLQLVSGSSQSRLKLRDTKAGSLSVFVEDTEGILISASKNNIGITPALPMGLIAFTCVQDTLTANGQTSTTVLAGPIADAHGNNVGSGVKVTVASNLCQIVASDVDTSISGTQLLTSANGTVSFALRAGTVAGDDTVSVASTQGTARGLKRLVLLESPYLRYVANSITHSVVSAGQNVSFALEVENTGGSRVYLFPSSAFGLSDGNDGNYDANLSDTAVVLPGARALLTFDTVSVPAQLDPGSYSPTLNLSGKDGNGCSFEQNVQAGVNTVSVIAMRIRTISARPRVIRGDANVTVEMTIRNEGTAALEVTAAGLSFSSAGHSYSLASPALPHTLAGGETRVFSFLVDVDRYAPLGACAIDGFASGEAGGVNVNDTHADTTASWIVQSSAVLSYVDGSLSTESVSLGQRHSFSVAILNSGTASVELDTSLTSIRFGSPGVEYVAHLAAPALLSGAGQTTIHFAETEVPASTNRGAHSVEIALGGTENEAAFADTLSCTPQSVRIELPAVLEYVSISPDTVSTGYSPSFSVVLKNRGEATALLLPQTRLSFGTVPKFEAFLSESLVVESESLRTLKFSASALDTGFATGGYVPELLVKIVENGIAEDTLLTTGSDTLVVQRRALFIWVAAGLVPSRVTVGQIAGFSLEVENQGDATALIEPTLCEVRIKDGANEFVANGQGTLLRIASRERAVLTFMQDTIPLTMAPQAYSVELSLEGSENMLPLYARIFSPQGELVVQSAPSLRYVHDSLRPNVVTQQQTVSFSLRVENTGDAALFLADSSFISLGPVADTVDCSKGCEVHGHSTESLYFKSVVLDSTAITPGLHAASLEFKGRDWNGSLFSQTLSTSPDSILVNKPGDLRVYSTTLNAPNAPHADTSQAFTVDVEVENVGQEDALDVVVSLSSNGGSTIGGPMVAGTIQGGSTKKLGIAVRAAASTGIETFTAHIESSVGAISGEPLSVGSAVDDTTVAIIELPALLSLSVSISEPSGATDGILSTQQNVKIRAVVANTGQGQLASGGAVRMTAPQGFVLFSPSVQSFDPGTAVEWTLGAPASASLSSAFLVAVESVPIALNTNQRADTLGASKILNVSVVNRVDLSLQAAITAPPDAADGSLHVGSPFTIVATVTNLGVAGTTGNGKIAISLPTGYALAQGYSQEQDFTIGAPLSWNAIAPSENSPIQHILMSISVIPSDENTNAEAYVSAGTRDIAVYVETANMIAEALPIAEAPALIAPGENSVKLMALRITNAQEIGEGSAIALKALSFFVGGEDNVRLVNPSAALSAVKLARYSSPDVFLGVASVSLTNPVRVALVPQADTLHPGQSDTLFVMVDVSQSPIGGGVTLEIEGGTAFEVVDLASGQSIGAVSADNKSFPRTFSVPSRWFTAVHNYPNPFKAGLESTRISYYLERDSRVTLKIYTLDGKLVFERTFSEQDPQGRLGLREILWDGKNGNSDVVLNGVYICKLEAAGVNATFKIAVAK
jgi:hypothetical protein